MSRGRLGLEFSSGFFLAFSSPSYLPPYHTTHHTFHVTPFNDLIETMLKNLLALILTTSLLSAYALPPYENEVEGRAAAVDNIVYVTDANKFW